MSFQERFSATDWETLQFGVMWVFRSVAGADGTIDAAEQAAIKKVVLSYPCLPSDLAREVGQAVAENLGLLFRKSVGDGRDFKSGLNEVTSILINNKIDPIEIMNFKKSLIAIGFYVANISGDEENTKVSGEEANVLRQIAFKLNLGINDLRISPTIQEIMELLSNFNPNEKV